MALERVAIILLQDVHGSCWPPHIIISLVSYSEVPGQPFTATPSFQPRCFFSLSGCLHWWGPDCVAWQSQAQWWAEKHKIMGGLLREALLRENIFFYMSLPPPTQPTLQLLFSHPRWWSQAGNESHRCGFNANQYCANIHLRSTAAWRERVLTYLKCKEPCVLFWARSWKMHTQTCGAY